MSDNKKPTAIQIGQRIKQARKMAGFDTAAQLLEQIPDWGTGRLGNYEAGISLPSPDDVKTISKVTDASPCWIIFGLGPIRSSGRDIQAIRHQNFGYIFENCKNHKGAITQFLKATGLSRKQVENQINNPFQSLSTQIARKSEKFAKRPVGWMDEQHVESDPLCAAFPDDMRHIMEIFSNLSLGKRKMLLDIANIIYETKEP
ncbi:MAG: helix-turn-helix domain-containing protein [Gammaproteobacteria bacterium]